MLSYGALTTVTNYHLIPKSEHVVDSVFMHDNYARTPTGEHCSQLTTICHARLARAARWQIAASGHPAGPLAAGVQHWPQQVDLNTVLSAAGHCHPAVSGQ